MRSETALALLAGVALAGCGADFSAAVHVTIDGPELSAGGGYWIDLRRPDGATIDGISRQFVAFVAGADDVTVVLERDAIFDGGDSRLTRLIVDAVPQRDASELARGTGLIDLERGGVVDVTVELADDPRPLAVNPAVAFDGAAATVTIDPTGLPDDMAAVFDLWVDGGEPVWLQRFVGDGAVTLDLDNHRSVIADHGLRFVVTAEPTDSPEPLVRSSGWPVLRGQMHPALVAALITAPAAEDGILAAMVSLLDTAEAHRGFALDAFGNDAGVTRHCEHVYSTLGGTDMAEDDIGGGVLRGDFDYSGDIMYVGGDATGIGLGTAEDPGYLRALFNGIGELEESHDVGDAEICAGNVRTANDAALTATAAFALNPADGTAASTFDTAVLRVRGAAHDDALVDTSPEQTTQCVIAELEQVADFELTPVAAGGDL